MRRHERIMSERLTAYCGLCCIDCIPSRTDLFQMADEMEAMLADMQFEKYAELKAESIEPFQAYSTFQSVLHHIRDLRCPKPCREGGGKPDCCRSGVRPEEWPAGLLGL